ncbi:putative sulfate permease [Erysiphe necator]|uniref:Putative sulfate permease n=1 Tax=Uncinula necator TaxID=52586 RepID=A0A0B1P2Z2_UNCNE|nr:putative sulfate permease [Erysiphe necator]KHJ31044.1 putative sulfate permease [Erysiphe necator]
MLPECHEPKGPKMKFKDRLYNDLKTDPNWARMKSLTTSAAKSLPSSTVTYLIDKLPIIRWLPTYSPNWILHDLIAGITIGLLLIPQSLAYAKIATVPEQYGLLSSWIPPLIYAFMGTSKDVCPGPTSIIGVLVAQVIKDYKDEEFSPQQIAGALTFLAGVISLLVGTMKMGFVLSFISVPILSGFVSAAGLLTILSQVPAFFGNTAGSGTARKIHDIFANLPEAKLNDTMIGLSCMIILILIEKAGKLWGKMNKVIWAIVVCRNAILILIFTIFSYFINRNAETPYFAISKTSEATINMPKLPPTSLFRLLFGRAIAIFLAMSMEHLAIAKTFSRKNGYKIDGSQELVFLGVSNLINGFFPTIPGGGSFSRSAVNSDSGVKTALSGIITSGFVLISLYFFTGALYWIPQASLSAVVILAVWSLLIGPSTFYKYWRISFTDFIASMIAFWVTFFVSIEIGIGLAVCFSILHIIFRMTFSSAFNINSKNWPDFYPDKTLSISTTNIESLLENTIIFNFKQPIVFLNAERCKANLLEAYQRHSSLISRSNIISESPQAKKSVSGSLSSSNFSSVDTLSMEPTKYSALDTSSMPILVYILDLSHVLYIDVTGIQALADARKLLNDEANYKIQWRFVGIRDSLRARLERAGWKLQEIGAENWEIPNLDESVESASIPLFRDMHHAVSFRRLNI